MRFEELRSTIDRQSYAEIALSLPDGAIAHVIHDFFAFLALPDSVKKQFAIDVKLDERDRGTDLGWRRRNVDAGFGYDNKEFFHYNDDARDAFAHIANDVPVARQLLSSAATIYDAVLPAMKATLQTCNERYPGISAVFFPEDERPTCVLRLLKYDRTRDGEFLAKGHYDRSSTTIAIAESAPGLRIGKDDIHLREVRHRPGVGLFFPGMSFAQYTDGAFPPSWHDVVQQGSTTFNNEASRWAVVFFCSPPAPNYFDRATVHTPLRVEKY